MPLEIDSDNRLVDTTLVDASLAFKAPTITDETYSLNVARMTVMWSVGGFGTFLLNFLNKTLEGTIYENSYVEVAATGTAAILASRVYAVLGMRSCFILSYSMCMVGGLLVYTAEANKLDVRFAAQWIGFHVASQKEAMDILVPQFIFLSKLGINMAYLSTYTASFSDETLFPASLRATAIGQC